jgi:sulfur carrier protein
MNSSSIKLQLNGQEQTCNANLNMPELLLSLGLNPRLVAIEYNGEILHRQFWDLTHVQSGDRLEIATIVGGG